MHSRVLWALLLAVPLCTLRAEDVLKLDELVHEAIKNNPELHAAQKRAEAVRQRPRQDGALPDPVLSVGYTAVGGPLPGYGLGSQPTAAIGFMVTQDLPYPGKRGLRSAKAAKEADAALQTYSATERSLAARVKELFHKLNHGYEMLDAIRHSQEMLSEFIKLTEVRYASGKARQEDIFRAQSELAVMEANAVKMQEDIDTATVAMNALLHRPVGTVYAKPFHPPPRPLEASLDELTATAERGSPLVLRGQKLAEASQISLALAEKNFRPDFAVSGGYYNMGSMPPMYQARLDIKLPAWHSKNEAALTEQVQSLAEARYQYEAETTEVRRKVKELYIAAHASWRLMQLYQDSVMAQTELAAASALASYEAGTGDATQVLLILISREEQEELYHAEMLSYFTAIIGLEEVTGMELL